MHEPTPPPETPVSSSRRKDPSTSFRTGFFKLFHREHRTEIASQEVPPLEKIAEVEPLQPAEAHSAEVPLAEVEPLQEEKPETVWHDVPDESPSEEPPKVDLIPGIVRGMGGLRLWVAFLSIGAVVLVLIVVFAHIALRGAFGRVASERLFERERISALDGRINEIERGSGNAEGADRRLKALEERIASHRDWRKLLDLFERELLPEVTLMQLRADEGGVVVVEARTSRVDVATSQVRHLEAKLGTGGTVRLGDVRVVAADGATQPNIIFRLTLTLSPDFWKKQ